MTCAIDSSVVLALLFREPGHEQAAEVVADGFLSTVNLAEALTVLQRRGIGEDDAHQALALIGVRIFPFDRDQAIATGFMNGVTAAAGLSLGDRACLALARALRVEAVTADRAWLEVAEATEVSVRMIR